MDDGDYYEDEDDLYESEDDLELEDERAAQPGACLLYTSPSPRD